MEAEREEDIKMTLEQFFKLLEDKPKSDYIVRLKYKADYEKKYRYSNEILIFEDHDYIWLYDWNEGETDIEVIGFVDVDDVMKNKSDWILCSERLPEENEVLCCNAYKDMIVGHIFIDVRNETGFSAYGDDAFLCDCIAWMPLPEPYKKEEEENVRCR